MGKTSVVWQWAGDSAKGSQDVWIDYDKKNQELIETAFNESMGKVKIDDERFVDLTDASQFYQRRWDDPEGKCRLVRRLEKGGKSASAAAVALPSLPVQDEFSKSIPTLQGRKFCLTGAMSKPRKQIEAEIKKYGGQVSATVSGTVTHLVSAGNDDTSKSSAATSRGIPVITEKQLNKMFARCRADKSIQPRSTWVPEVRNRDPSIFHSKFSGIPYLAPGDEWPKCCCHKHMNLMMQLNLAQCPPEFTKRVGNTGLIQLFACMDFCPSNDGAENVRFIANPDQSVTTESVVSRKPKFEYEQVAKEIVGWVHKCDIRSQTEDDDDDNDDGDDGSDDEVEECDNEFLTVTGDKIGGWCNWCQGVEYPMCPKCDEKMTNLVMQIEGNPSDFCIGDAGTAHVFQCSKHKSEFHFGWACS